MTMIRRFGTSPISFTIPLMRRLLAGAMVQTRRPFGVHGRRLPGDLLWVREPFHFEERFDGCAPLQVTQRYHNPVVYFSADQPAGGLPPAGAGRRRFAREMPRALHRVHLRITAIRNERLHDVSDRDAVLEGARDRADFAALWDSLHVADRRTITGDLARWADNPCCTVITFDRIDHRLPMELP